MYIGKIPTNLSDLTPVWPLCRFSTKKLSWSKPLLSLHWNTFFAPNKKRNLKTAVFIDPRLKNEKKNSRSRHGQNPGRVYKIELQCKKWYETYIFYLTIVFVTPNTTRKISLRVSIVTKKIYKTFSFQLQSYLYCRQGDREANSLWY